MATSFRTLWSRLGPDWLVNDGADGELVGYSLGLMIDVFAERTRLGLLARMPETAPSDALPRMGRDRRVLRGRNESASSYAQRLLRWLDDRRTQGNAFALMDRLADYLGPVPSYRIVDARGNWYGRAANGTKSFLLDQANWNWDGVDPARWCRFWVIIYPNGLWSQDTEWGAVSGPSWGSGSGSWGSTATPDEVQTVRRIVRDWKRAGSRCVNVIVAFDPASFDPTSPEPDGTWGQASKNDGGVQVPSRLGTAIYWDGTS